MTTSTGSNVASKICLCDWPLRYTPAGGPNLDSVGICELAKRHNLAIELPQFEDLPYLKQEGVTIVNLLPALSTGDPAYRIGLANEQSKVESVVMPAYIAAIDAAAECGANVLVFTGVLHPDEYYRCLLQMKNNLRKIANYAEEKGVTLELEHLNNMGDHPDSMLGHANYFGSDLGQLARFIRECGSPRVKLLFDVYHVALMHPGKHIELLRQNIDIIGHVHVAGVVGGKPSRVELDAPGQEIDFREVVSVLGELGYEGYIGLEYVLTPGRSAEDGVAAAVKILTA